MNVINQTTGMFFCLIVLGINGFLGTRPAKAEDPPTELYVKTTPEGAKVFLDGKELGVTPGFFEVEPGTAKLVLKLEGHDPIEKEMDIPASKITRLEMEFKKASRAIEQGPGTNRVGGRNSIPVPSASEVLSLVEKAKKEVKEGRITDARFTLEKAHGLALKLKGVDFSDFGPKDRALQEIVQAYLVLKDFQSALTTAKEIWNSDRRQQAFLDVVMGAVQAGDTETAIDYSHQIEKDYRVVLTELYPSKTKKLKELLDQKAKGKKTNAAGRDSEASASDKVAFAEVLKIIEEAKGEAKEGKPIDAHVTLEKAHDLAAELKSSSDATKDCSKNRALHEIVRAYVVLKDFNSAYAVAKELNYSERRYVAERDVILGAARAGETEITNHYIDKFKELTNLANRNEQEELEKLLAKMPDPDGPVFEEVKKLVAKAQQQAKEGDAVGAQQTLEKASGLAVNMRSHDITSIPGSKPLDCYKYKALQRIVHAYVILKDFESAYSTAKEIRYQDRRNDAFLDIVIGTYRAGEIDKAARFLDKIQTEERLQLKTLDPSVREKLQKLLDDQEAGHGREPIQGKGSKPRNEKKGPG